MEHILNFEDFLNEENSSASFIGKVDEAKLTGKEVNVDISDFKDYFNKNYSHISHSLSNKEVQKFLDQDVIKRVSLKKAADYFADYLMANDLADDVSL